MLKRIESRQLLAPGVTTMWLGCTADTGLKYLLKNAASTSWSLGSPPKPSGYDRSCKEALEFYTFDCSCRRKRTAVVRCFWMASLYIPTISGRTSQFSDVERSILRVALVRSAIAAAIFGRIADAGFCILEESSAMLPGCRLGVVEFSREGEPGSTTWGYVHVSGMLAASRGVLLVLPVWCRYCYY